VAIPGQDRKPFERPKKQNPVRIIEKRKPTAPLVARTPVKPTPTPQPEPEPADANDSSEMALDGPETTLSLPSTVVSTRLSPAQLAKLDRIARTVTEVRPNFSAAIAFLIDHYQEQEDQP
jgi:hypothetical protein